MSRDFVRAVAVTGDRILWAAAAERDDESLQITIERLLARSPLPRWPSAAVVAAVGPSSAQTKRLTGLPSIGAGYGIDAIVRESAARLFLRNGIPLVTAVSKSTEGEAWGTAFDRPIVEAIERACRARRLHLVAIAPSVAVLGLALEGERFVWNDGDATAEVERRGTELRIRRRVVGSSLDAQEARAPVPTRLLASLGGDAWRFADALGAAMAPRDVLAWRPNASDARALPRWRLIVACLAILIAATAWLVGPGVTAGIAQRRAEVRLAAIADVRGSIVMAERELARVNNALIEIAAFDSGAIPATMVLADLTRAMPDGAAIVALRLTSETSTLMALAPRAATILTALERVPGVEAGEIVGPVTRDVVGTQSVERVSVRFRFRTAARQARAGNR